MTSTIWGATMSLGMSWLIPLLISITLLLWLGWIWLPFLVGNKDRPHEFFLFSIAVIVNLVVIPYSWMHNLTLLLLPVGYSLLLISQKSNLVRVIGLILVFLVMYPLMYLLFILIGIPQVTQAYQIIPALFLLLGMMLLENKNIQTENFYV